MPASSDAEFRRQLHDALPSANIPTLLLLLHQFTGDDAWISEPYTLTKSRWDDNDAGGLAPELQTVVRQAAAEAIMAWRGGASIAKPELTADDIIAMMSFSEAEDIPTEYAALMTHKLQKYAGAEAPAITSASRFTVLVIGAGMSGVAAAVRLGQAGVNFTIIEKQADAGGVWNSHAYPGCGVDTAGHLYSYTFASGDWEHYYPLRDEVAGYFQGVSKDLGVQDKVRFGTECLETVYDETEHVWRSRLRGPDGTEEVLVSDFVISAVGAFTTPKWPAVPGLQDFDGPMVHTSAWDPTIDLEGKRVAVIGNGASAMQLVPAIVDRVSELTVFQRSRHWAAPFPKLRVPVPDAMRFLMNEVPHYAWLYRLRLSWIFDSQVHEALQIDPEWTDPDRSINATNDGHRAVFSAYIDEQLADRPDLIDKVKPDFPPFGKRMLLDNGWYRSLAKPHVSVVDGGAVRVEGNTVFGANGEQVEVDVLVVATGYDVTRFLSPVTVVGRQGLNIRDAWDDDDSRAYLGTVVPEFPNFFMLYGPNTALGHGGSFIFTVECQIDYVLSILGKVAEHSIVEIECRQDVYDRYNERIQQMHAQMIWSHPGMSTYFRNDRGRVVTNSPWRSVDFWQMTREADLRDFTTVSALSSV